jgi:ribonuclease HII
MLFEEQYLTYQYIFATDEAGRGPLAGPVVAAVVKVATENEIKLKQDLNYLLTIGVTDSKKLNQTKRLNLLTKLNLWQENEMVANGEVLLEHGTKLEYAITEFSAEVIDRVNILQASLKAMRSGVVSLFKSEKKLSQLCLIDGNKSFEVVDSNLHLLPIVKGDQKSVLIGLASILAKTYRDKLMQAYAGVYPQYGFDKHYGYPTKQHYQALKDFGACPIHRKTFKGVKV